MLSNVGTLIPNFVVWFGSARSPSERGASKIDEFYIWESLEQSCWLFELGGTGNVGMLIPLSASLDGLSMPPTI